MPVEADKEVVPPIGEGTLIAGKYRLGGVIASGGMGVVMLAVHVELDQQVAVKFLHREVADKPEIRERFLREARAAARLRSDHVVRVYDVGTHDSTPYMVMEYLEGADLGSERAARGFVSVTQAIDWVMDALDAVAEAHQLGIVHRDLKPSNLFLVDRGTKRSRPKVKVLDFGISKLESGHVDGALTGTGLLLGSPSYMSPEQVRDSKNVDARSDVWSLGVILWELLSGEPAFPGSSLGDIFAKIREEPLQPIRTLRPEVPGEVEAVVSRCLERDRAKRYADAAELRDALAPFGSRSSARPPASDAHRTMTLLGNQDPAAISAATTVAADSLSPTPSREVVREDTVATWSTERRSSRRALVRYVVGAVLLLGVGAAALAWSRTASKTGPAASSVVAPVAAPAESPPVVEPKRLDVVPVVSAAAPEPAAPPQPSAMAQSSAPHASKSAPPRKDVTTKTPPATGVGKPVPPAPPKDDLGI